MIPVYQRIIDKDIGDCYTACLASIMSLPYEAVPQFLRELTEQGREYDFYNVVGDWLNAKGYCYVMVHERSVADWRGMLGCHAIATVPSQKYSGGTHAVVVKWVQSEAYPDKKVYKCVLVHDPNPENKPYHYKDIMYFTFIVPQAIYIPPNLLLKPSPL